MKLVRSLVVLATLCCIGFPALAQQAPPPAAEPGWAKGRPKTDAAMKMAIPVRGRSRRKLGAEGNIGGLLVG